MIFHLYQWIQNMADAGANQYTFHYEATDDPTTCIRKIREAGMKACLNLCCSNEYN